MNRPCFVRCGRPALTALLLLLLVPGCGDDDSVKPEPHPDLSMSLECDNGLIDLTARNAGAAMSEPELFVAAFADGRRDTMLVSLGAHDSLTCRLSNIHGGVTITNAAGDLEAAITGDCLAEYLETMVSSVDLRDYVPSPLTQTTYLYCTYTLYLNNLDYDQPTFELIRTDSGLTLRYVYANITGGIAGSSPEFLCTDFTGTIAISSIVVETDILIGEGDNPQVTLGETTATIDGFQVNVDGAFGFVVETIVGWFQDTFTGIIESGIASAINSYIGTDLSGRVIVHSSCEQ